MAAWFGPYLSYLSLFRLVCSFLLSSSRSLSLCLMNLLFFFLLFGLPVRSFSSSAISWLLHAGIFVCALRAYAQGIMIASRSGTIHWFQSPLSSATCLVCISGTKAKNPTAANLCNAKIANNYMREASKNIAILSPQ